MPLTPVYSLLPLAAADPVSSYVPVLIMFAFAFALAVTMLVLSWTVGKKGGSNPTKDIAYECGMNPVTDAHQRFDLLKKRLWGKMDSRQRQLTSLDFREI